MATQPSVDALLQDLGTADDQAQARFDQALERAEKLMELATLDFLAEQALAENPEREATVIKELKNLEAELRPRGGNE